MSYVMQHETWMKLTEVSLKPRSKYLRRVDKALAQYQKTKSNQDLSKLKVALHQWKMSKGYNAAGKKPQWMLSDRNSKKAVETLDKQIFGIPESVNQEVLNDLAQLPFYGIEAWADDGVGRRAMKEAREQSLFQMFEGAEVIMKKPAIGLAIGKIKWYLSSAKSSAGQATQAAASAAAQPLLARAQTLAQEMIQQVLGEYPIEVATEVIKFLHSMIPSFLTEVAASITPYVSLVKSGGQAIYNAAQAIRSEYQWVTTEAHLDSFAPGDPFAAVEAVRRMIERKRNQYARLAGIYGTDTAIRAGAVLIDAAAHGVPAGSAILGPMAALGKSLALMSLEIFLVGRDFYEKYKVNKVLVIASPDTLSNAIFKTCPLLGCYYVAGATTSDIINFAVEDIGATGWQLDVEVMKRTHIDPMIGFAREAINDARLEVKGLERSKAAVNDTTAGAHGISNPKNRLQKAMVAKLSAVLPFVDDPNDYQQVAKKQGYQVVAPDVLKGRIRGQGPRG